MCGSLLSLGDGQFSDKLSFSDGQATYDCGKERG